MVQLQLLSSIKGNSGQRFFPYTGYLGLTPIRVEGVVRTKLDADLKPLQAKAITISVRCYETRTGRVNVLQSRILVDYTHTLWSKPDNQDYENIGNMDFPFRMSVPANVSGYSTATFVDYRCVWRVEAVLHHNYIHGVGARLIRHFDLPLIRYDVPYYPSSSSSASLDQVTTKLRAPRIKYSLNSPKTPIGPLDLVSVPIHLQPVDPAVSIRSASMVVERRIQLYDIQPLSAPSSSSPLHLKKTSSSSSLSSPNSTLEPSPSSSNYPSSLSSYDTFNSNSPDPSLLAVNLYPHPSLPPHSKSPEYNFDPLASTSSLASSIPTITPGTVYPSSCAASVISESTPLIPHSQDSSTSSPQSQTRFFSHSNSHSRSISHTVSPNLPPSGHYESIPPTPATDTPSTPSSPPPSSPLSPPKTIVNSIADVSSSGNFTRDGNGVFTKTLTLQWPAAKGQSRWAVGETIKGSDLVSVRFFLRTKVCCSPTRFFPNHIFALLYFFDSHSYFSPSSPHCAIHHCHVQVA
ncbi:hypothetical protein BJ165DRAFT_581628 [Panaeolus papilionaceus]|nr:hypothetical protein BJ165DRAFT_581628 [Panaeolus papilionaceus]